MEQPDVHDNPALQRFEMQVEGRTVFADYRRRPGVLVITHVETPPELRGQGAAGRLMQGVVDHARAEGLHVSPLCSYAHAWLKRHPEYGDLVV